MNFVALGLSASIFFLFKGESEVKAVSEAENKADNIIKMHNKKICKYIELYSTNNPKSYQPMLLFYYKIGILQIQLQDLF